MMKSRQSCRCFLALHAWQAGTMCPRREERGRPCSSGSSGPGQRGPWIQTRCRSSSTLTRRRIACRTQRVALSRSPRRPSEYRQRPAAAAERRLGFDDATRPTRHCQHGSPHLPSGDGWRVGRGARTCFVQRWEAIRRDQGVLRWQERGVWTGPEGAPRVHGNAIRGDSRLPARAETRLVMRNPA